jgi:hypothetical protein
MRGLAGLLLDSALQFVRFGANEDGQNMCSSVRTNRAGTARGEPESAS